MADAINSGVVPNMRQLHQQMELDPKLAQWDTARHKVDGLSSNLRKLQGDLEPVQQLWKEVTGTAEGFNMAATLVGSRRPCRRPSMNGRNFKVSSPAPTIRSRDLPTPTRA